MQMMMCRKYFTTGMNNKFTNYISNLSMEMYLSHMVVFRIVEKIGVMERIESPVIRYMTTYLLLVMLLVNIILMVIHLFMKL